jgi:RNA polymerase sigma-70 factor (ECF subfamily)
MVAILSHTVSFTPAPLPSARAERSAASRQDALHDKTLVSRFNAGDSTAFDEIISRYRSKIFSVAFTRLRSRSDAEEIAQDTFIRAHRGLAAFRGDSSLYTWLHRITVNLASNRYWHLFRRARHLTHSLDLPVRHDSSATVADFVSSEAPGPARESTMREFSTLVASCMEQLNPPQREILERRNTLNCSYDEIAAALGINVGTVKSRIARARGNLRILLAKSCPGMIEDSFPRDWFDPVRNWEHS